MLLLLLLFVAGRCLVPMDETDVFFNLRLGEVVLESGRVPTTNLLSFTYPSALDVNLAWLFQIVLALAYRAAGIAGTVLLKTAFVVSAWAILFRVAVRRGARPALAALVLALAAWAAEPRFVERPHLVTFVGLALLLLAIERAEKGQPRMLLMMIPAGLVWANGNSCFFLAPAVLLLYALGAWRDGLGRDARRAALVALALVPLMVATPSGLHGLSYVANHFRMPYLRPLQEYRYARWPLDGPFFFLVGAVALGRVLPLLAPRLETKIPDRVFLPCAVLAVLGGLRIRFVAEFAMLAGPAVAVALTSIVPTTRERWQRLGVGIVLVGLTAWPRASALAEGGRVLDLGLEPDLVPFAAIDFVEKHGLRQRMYNDLEVGSYLTWHGWPNYPVFQDPRINGYPEELHAVLRRPDLSRAEWQGLLDRFAVTSALITFPSQNPRGALFDPALWALVYRENDGLVFVRRSTGKDLPEIPLTFVYSEDEGLRPSPLASPPNPSSVSACEWQLRLGAYHQSVDEIQAASQGYDRALGAEPASDCGKAARVAAGAMAMRLGDADKAARLLEGAQDLVARTNHGFALLGLGQAAAALADFDQVLAVEPASDEASFGRGMALSALGRREDAAAAFEALLARSPMHISAKLARQELLRLRAKGR